MDFFKQNTAIPFLAWRRFTLPLAAALMLGSVLVLVFNSLNFALDFTGGTVVEVQFPQAADLPALREALAEQGYADAIVQAFGSPRDVVIRLSPRGREDLDAGSLAEQVMAALAASGFQVELRRSDFIGPQVGKELAESGIIAIIVVIIGIIVYVGFRFQLKFGLAAIAAEVHDVLITLAFLSLLAIEFDLTVLAAVLAVVGYSINDKIVVFDRVREAFLSLRKADSESVINRAINQTLSRTIITSGTTMFTLLALYLFGGAALQGFALTLLFGIALGTYSSIMFAGPMLLKLGVTKQDLLPVVKEDNPVLSQRP